jgi:hypothetical protein
MIFAAATTVLLLGIRINHHTTDSIMQKYTARTVITVLEEMASDGVISEAKRENDGSWFVRNNEKKILLSYDGVGQAVYTGTFRKDSQNPQLGSVILEKVPASYVVLDGKVLTLSLETEDGTYTASVYCRAMKIDGDENFEQEESIYLPNDEDGGRETLLKMLDSQTGTYGGIIKHSDGLCPAGETDSCENYNFFSQWYTENYNTEKFAGWNADTPWCACFVSWGLSHVKDLPSQGKYGRWFGNVDNFMNYFTQNANKANCWKKSNEEPKPGDLIFFNMVDDDKTNPSHMGVVLEVDNSQGKTIIKTIEGNSADMVAKRTYELGDSRILGYGDPWAAQ